jgi:hypothetical protein
MKVLEANLKKMTAKADGLEEKAAIYDSDWAKGLNLVLAACTLKMKKELQADKKAAGHGQAVGQSASTSAPAALTTSDALSRGLKRFPAEAHGSMLA